MDTPARLEQRPSVQEAFPVRLEYLPSIDGLRALSIALVVVSHSGLEGVVPGNLGVSVFFVISGYLITWQIVREIEATRHLDTGRFYLRRVFRLGPGLLVYLAVFVPLTAALGAPMSWGYALSGLFYYQNYYRIFFDPTVLNPFAIEWSLAIEEQYYLVFPWIMLALSRRLRAAALLGALTLAAVLAWRVWLVSACGGGQGPWALCGLPSLADGTEMQRIYLAFDTRIDAICAGAMVALGLNFHRDACRRWLYGHLPFWLAAVAMVLTLAIRNQAFRDTLRYTVQSIAIGVLLLNVIGRLIPWADRILCWRPLLYVGRLSYSLYLYHWGVLLTLVLLGMNVSPRAPWPLALYYAASFGCAALSYHLVEQPMLRLRRRLGSRGP